MDLAGRSAQPGTELPSWVPDCRHPVDSSFVRHAEWYTGDNQPHLRFLSLPRPKSSSGKRTHCSNTDAVGTHRTLGNVAMELSCILQDRIDYKSPSLPPGSPYLQDNIAKIQEILCTDMAHLNELGHRYITGETLEQAYAGAIIANTTHEGRLSTRDYENGFIKFHAWVNAGRPDPDPIYSEAVENSGFLRRNPFCLTTHGLMCLVPRMTAVGDYIAMLSGFNMPVALRRIGAPALHQFELLGPCYVHRMMRGRVWNLILEFKCKYYEGSEDEGKSEWQRDCRPPNWRDMNRNECEDFSFNAKSDYESVLAILGSRRISLV